MFLVATAGVLTDKKNWAQLTDLLTHYCGRLLINLSFFFRRITLTSTTTERKKDSIDYSAKARGSSKNEAVPEGTADETFYRHSKSCIVKKISIKSSNFRKCNPYSAIGPTHYCKLMSYK